MTRPFQPPSPLLNGAVRDLSPGVQDAPRCPAPDLNENRARAGRRAPRARAAPAPTPDNTEQTRILRSVAASAAHDMAGFLLMLESNLDLVAQEWLSSEGLESIRSMRIATTFLRDLGRELRMGAADAAPLTHTLPTVLEAWWPDMGALLRALHGESVIVRADIPPGLPGLCIKSHHLTRAILNLVGNSAHAVAESALGDSGHAPSADYFKAAQVEIVARLVHDGSAVRLTITDDGPGMSAAVMARAGEMSFTTRADRGGTGMGLAIVQRLVGAVGGSVHLDSAVGAGTTVSIELPTGIDRRPRASGPTR